VNFPRLQRLNPEQDGTDADGGPQRTGLATVVIMAGVLMTAVDTTIVVLAAILSALRGPREPKGRPAVWTEEPVFGDEGRQRAPAARKPGAGSKAGGNTATASRS
jgi:hypothetical protein